MGIVKRPDPTIQTPVGHPRHEEERLDEAIEESFPASDPVSIHIDTPEEHRDEPTPPDRGKGK